MAKKLYVGNLSYSTTREQLEELFSQVGEVAEVTIINDRETGRSKGFGFVEMATEEAAQEAVRRFNGQQFDNRPLTVNEARPREDRGGYSDRGGYGGDRGDRGGYGGDRGGRSNYQSDRRDRY